jgi:hypothetical protein
VILEWNALKAKIEQNRRTYMNKAEIAIKERRPPEKDLI